MQQIIAVEADNALVAQLKQQFQQHSITVQEAAVATKSESAVFYRYNLPQCNALSVANKALKHLFPGLKLQEQQELETIELATLLQPYALKGQENLLLLELPAQNLALLEHLASHALLNHFNHLMLQHSTEPLYAGAASLADIQAFLAKEGYEIQDTDDSDPDFPVLRFYRDAQAIQLKQAEAITAELQQQLAEEKKQAEQEKAALTKQLDEAKQQLAAEKKQAEQEKAELTKQLDEAKQQLTAEKKQAEQEKAALAKQLEEAKQQLEQKMAEHRELKADKDAMRALQSAMQQQFTQQTDQLKQAANALGQHISKTQLEQQQHLQHFFGLQQFLRHGETAIVSDSWAIAADTLNNVVELLNSQSYDAIIEFGSGTSTLVIAKTLVHQSSEIKELIETSKARYLEQQEMSEQALQHFAYDLPSRVLSFEQSDVYFKQSQQALSQHGLAALVDLVFSPLVPTAFEPSGQQEETALFYDCEAKLSQLAQQLATKQARVLVIVDGPSSPTKEPLIRYPALPSVLAHFSAHKLDILLDDSKRQSEQQVLQLWQELCDQRGLSVQRQDWQSSKGAALLQINY